MKLKPIPANIVVHTPTKESIKELLAILHKNGWFVCAPLDHIMNEAKGIAIYPKPNWGWWADVFTAKVRNRTVLSLDEFKRGYLIPPDSGELKLQSRKNQKVMKRQIKFRAKTTANGHWVYGSLINHGNGLFSIRNSKSQPWVQEDSIGQFTELLDSNSKEIYEGDILAYKWMDGDIAEVDYYSVHFIDGAFSLKGECGITPLYEQDMSEYEVVDNINDSPDLLNGKQSKS